MFRRYRQRRGPYALATPSPVPGIIRGLILIILVGLLFWYVGAWFLNLFGGGNQVQREIVALTVEGRGNVSVSLEEGLMQRAEQSMNLFDGDRLTTGANSHASLAFFDGTRVRIDEESDVTIKETTHGSEDSAIEFEVAQGGIWMKTPTIDAFSGAIVRTVTMPEFTIDIPSDAELALGTSSIMVFSADGDGVHVVMSDSEDEITIGEGQQLQFPESADLSGDIARYRSAIDPLVAQGTFIAESRAAGAPPDPSDDTDETPDENDDLLTVIVPAEDAVITGNTVKVQGSIGEGVDRVRVNGYQALVDGVQQTFSQELSLRDETEVTINVEALDANGIILAQTSRTVRRGAATIAAPTITSPAAGGQTYRTQRAEVEIKGTAPARTSGIMVNEYKLQLFREGDTTWSYLAGIALRNMKEGTNTYDVYALDAAGKKSDPVRITILWEPGAEGVVGGTVTQPSSAGAASSVAVVDETTLPTNDPLNPGSLRVTGPTAGTTHTATGSEFLIEGTTIGATASVWVNGYRLQLYQPGKTTWNYIAKTEFQNLKPGRNVYTVVSRNADGEILDTVEYVVTYNP